MIRKMLNFVKVISTRIEDGKRFIKFLRYGKYDVQESVESLPFGIDSNSPKDWIAVYATTGEIGQTTIVGYINKRQISDVGEFRIYSLDSENVLATYIHLKNDGTMEIGGDTDFMVRFSELKSGFDRLKDDFNDHLTNYNTHVHAGVTVGAGSTAVTTSVSPPSGASIDASKIDEIKTI